MVTNAGRSVPGADPDHDVGGVLVNEHTLFHEDGHILADALKIRSRNAWVNELIPGIFTVAYITAQRLDLNFLLEERRTGSRPDPRYTSLADLDYLYGGVGDRTIIGFNGTSSALQIFSRRTKAFRSSSRNY